MTHHIDLPRPAPGRWRPLWLGLVDLSYYDIEEFHFHNGSLLLAATTAPASRRCSR
jgi:hypothetical protein